MVKNYLVGAVRESVKIWGPWNGKGDNDQRAVAMAQYHEMYKLSRLSAKKFLVGEWEEIFHTAPVLDARMFQIAQWYLVKELWFREPCNILCMGADTMFIKPTEFFDQYKEFRMFNYSDPKTHPELPHNFNDDIRYFPSTMDPAIWEIGERHMADWFDHAEADWACGQHLNNHMLWAQGLTAEQVLEPRKAWQILGTANDSAWNGCDINEAQVLHFHGSRGSMNRLEVMTNVAKQIGLV